MSCTLFTPSVSELLVVARLYLDGENGDVKKAPLDARREKGRSKASAVEERRRHKETKEEKVLFIFFVGKGQERERSREEQE